MNDNPYTVRVKTEDGVHTFKDVAVARETDGGTLAIGRRKRNADGVAQTFDVAHFKTWDYWLRQKMEGSS